MRGTKRRRRRGRGGGRRGQVPKADLLFANQTQRALRAFARAEELRRVGGAPGGRATIVPLVYHGGRDEPGAQRLFDFSSVALAERWEAGHGDMTAAIAQLG
jgi:hypothetical protein